MPSHINTTKDMNKSGERRGQGWWEMKRFVKCASAEGSKASGLDGMMVV